MSQVSQQKNNDNRKHGVDAVSVFDLAIAWPEPPPGDLWPIGHKFPEPVARPEPSPPRTDPWAELEKLPLMDGDRAHIKKHLRGRSRADQAQLLAGYVERWREAADAEPISHKKANSGRRAANIWIRGAS